MWPSCISVAFQIYVYPPLSLTHIICLIRDAGPIYSALKMTM